jgi:hypothetical protein
MSRIGLATFRITRHLRLLAVVLLLLAGVSTLRGQCPTADDDVDTNPHPLPHFKTDKPPVLEEPILPEAGFLSDTHYTSQFFGFSMDLPLNVQGHEIMMSVMPEREHALLSLQFEKGQQHGYITITAQDPKPGLDVKTPDQQQQAQLRQWAQSGGPLGSVPAFPIPEYMLHTGRFYYSLRHKGGMFAAQYWTAINNYVVKVVVGTNDKDFLARAKKAMAEVQFYCAQEDGTLTKTNGKAVKVVGEPYQGPTVPTFRVNQAIRDQPGKAIPAGEVSDSAYRNPDIGLQYRFPKGWQALPPDRSDPPPDNASREYQFLHACSQTLLRLVPRPSAGQSYRDGPMIVLRAMDYNCLSMRTAVTLADKRPLDEVAATLEEMGEFGQIDTDQLKTISDHLFMVFHGTVGKDLRGEELAQRQSQTIYATRFNKLLLVWSLMAPTKSDLEQIPTAGIELQGSPPIELRKTLRAQNKTE